MNNIGFLEVCKIRPDGLFIFHDVDTYPTYWGSISYDTKLGEIRHAFGIPNENIGGICCFWKKEYEKINGFPNYWGWGIEDVTIRYRANKYNIHIDESNIVYLDDTKRCYFPKHYKNVNNEKECANKNIELHNNELKSGDSSNGLSNIEYEVLSSFELDPRFTIINVDFKLKINS